MAWPVTIDGTTYTESMFAPFGYATNFPLLAQSFANVAGDVATKQGLAATAATDAQTALAAFTGTRLANSTLTAATALTYALHQGKVIFLTSSGAPTVAWADTGDGFFAMVFNARGVDVQVAVTGLTLAHPDGHTRIRAGGMVAVLVEDDGVTRRLILTGQTIA